MAPFTLPLIPMTRTSPPLALVLGFALALSACDTALTPDPVGDLSTAELDEAAQIVADALAEDSGGLVAVASDATASVSAAGLTDGPRGIRGGRDSVRERDRCRSGYALAYDETTGTHVVTYECHATSGNARKDLTARLSYQYRDAQGGFVPRPSATWDEVATVDFVGARQGTVQLIRGDLQRSSSFDQQGRWTLTGLADDAAPAELSVRQRRSGTHERVGPGGSGARTFEVSLEGDQIQIREREAGLGYAAVGQLSYTLTMAVRRGGEAQTRDVRGTIDLQDDGRALLRVFGLRAVYRVSLADGETGRDA